jgi:hypothetical protein
MYHDLEAFLFFGLINQVSNARDVKKSLSSWKGSSVYETNCIMSDGNRKQNRERRESEDVRKLNTQHINNNTIEKHVEEKVLQHKENVLCFLPFELCHALFYVN